MKGGGWVSANEGVITEFRETQNSARKTRALHGGRGYLGVDGITRRVMNTVRGGIHG
ncbi:hypothetical protein HNQ64_000040 [Prosthecobacter dejongeii]|uniref:Uncharacterized protein n=1 Tax=Prosthecobacter dejongeii TaxID=48465 RepID=A0A7W7YGK9_9BACT|nr:hypothetical protein [Prosthecobacter dejongeii]